MLLRDGFITIGLIAVAGCAAPPITPLSAGDLWQDKIFNFQPTRVAETKNTLAELDPTLAAELSATAIQNMNAKQRLEYLVELFFPSGRGVFSYSAIRSAGAAETWRSKRGDCLSLTLLSFAVAKALGIPAQMQEVRVPVAINRRGNIDFLSGHVNVRFPDAPAINLGGRVVPRGDLVLDFEPRIGSRERGQALSEDDMLARFFNNRAADHLAQENDDLAYAYFKAAIDADPRFSAAYSNLAQLYSRRGLFEAAERLLRYAIALKDPTDAPLRALHKLLVDQGRGAEARQYAAMLKRFEDDDPYYWLGIGLDHLRHGRHAKAVDALERAEALTRGFAEIHRHLAMAYWHNGQQGEASKQLSLLADIDRNDTEAESMRKKFHLAPKSVPLQ